MSAPVNQPPGEDPIRAHTFDGIQEYDKRLPNWWLFTLYITVVFSIIYWLYYHNTGVGLSDDQVFEEKMAAVQEAKLANSLGTLGESELWAMSLNPKLVDSGRAIFMTNCAACHLASLKGKAENPTAIGPSLVDNEWIHGGRPSDVRRVITNGVLEKGMLAWGSVLGDRKIVEVTAFVMSHHPAPAGTKEP